MPTTSSGPDWQADFERRRAEYASAGPQPTNGARSKKGPPPAGDVPPIPEELQRLVDAVPAERAASATETAEWVMGNYFLPWPAIHADGVPSRGALLMMWWLRQEPGALGDLFKTVFREAAAMAETDPDGGFEDDGRIITILEELRESREHHHKERHVDIERAPRTGS